MKISEGADGSTDDVIHVEDPRHPEYRSYGDAGEKFSDDNTPILASDEVQKDSKRYSQLPAVHPPPERHGSAFEESEAPSRPTSRPSTLHQTPSYIEQHRSTPLDDVEEYEPLFDEEEEKRRAAAKKAEEARVRHFFPSKDVWEDAPDSVHFSAEVQSPEPEDAAHLKRRQSREEEERSMTPAQIFAQHQEELAEKKTRGPKEYFPRNNDSKPTWAGHQSHLQTERAASSQRFPSRDIWEDVPESQLYSTTVDDEQEEESSKPPVPVRPTKKLSTEKPAIPDRPKPKSAPSDESASSRPPVSDKPKPQVPTRPTKSLSGDSVESAAASKPKPPVPSRPVGGKIAALQAGFMNDLNKRLQLGPQAQKKEEPKEEEAAEVTEKAPLSDARKGRARGPQRRAPPKADPAPTTSSAPVLSFSLPQTSWAIDPDAGTVAIDEEEEEVKGLPTDEPAAAAVEGKAIEADLAGETPHIPATEEAAVSDKPVLSEEPPAVEEEEEEEDDDEEDEEEGVQKEVVAPQVEQKTLVANTAGESILEADIEKKAGDVVEPVDVKDEVKA